MHGARLPRADHGGTDECSDMFAGDSCDRVRLLGWAAGVPPRRTPPGSVGPPRLCVLRFLVAGTLPLVRRSDRVFRCHLVFAHVPVTVTQ